MKDKNWFAVDREGLKNLIGKKGKKFILRELVQNALDEPITQCRVNMVQSKGMMTLSIEDDSPIGFRNLTHAYTLFADTYKRRDSEKRGRFNIGEKLVFAVCTEAKVETTTGTIVFDSKGRHNRRFKRDSGSMITIKLRANKQDAGEMLEDAMMYLVPKGINYYVNGVKVDYVEPDKIFKTTLQTEIEKEGTMSRTKRMTKVHLHKTRRDTKYIFEMGIPITDIECGYDIDVQQKIPLSLDRETVLPSFLQDLYAEVLNNTYEDIEKENSSDLWVRSAMSDDRIEKEAVESIVKKRFGDKVAVANNFDPNSIDEAISHGYNVVHGSEMGSAEWENIKRFGAIESTSDRFGTNFTNAQSVRPTVSMDRVGKYAQKIAKRLLGIDIGVEFVKGGFNMVVAQYGHRVMTFNVSRLKGFFDITVCPMTTSLILHELGHEKGHHTEHSYHECITKMAGKLVMIALEEPEFFGVD